MSEGTRHKGMVLHIGFRHPSPPEEANADLWRTVESGDLEVGLGLWESLERGRG